MFKDDQRNYYLNKEYMSKFNKSTLVEINNKLNPNVVKYLGYELVEKIK